MKRKLIVVTGLLVAVAAIAFDTNVAEARCCRARRSCGWNGSYGCNTGCNTGCQNVCSTGGCQVPGGQLMAQPGQPAAAAPQAEVVAPPPPEAAPAPAPAPTNKATPAPPESGT